MGRVRELRFAVAMNGGVSLAVWIGGVAYELSRFCKGEGTWASHLPNPFVRRVDVLSGTSAGGINAIFLALNQLFGSELRPLRDLWLDQAGLEPPSDTKGKHLLRDPADHRPPSLLDGAYFHEQLQLAIDRLIPQGPVSPTTNHPLDLRLTTTSLEGLHADVKDDLGSDFHNYEHDAVFHFRHKLSNRCDFTLPDAERATLVDRLARAARSTAAYPFAFEPSRCLDDRDGLCEGVLERAKPDHHLLDGGVLNNLPIDEATDAIFRMPASEPVCRYLVAVVPDPSTHIEALLPDARRTASVWDVVSASLVSIPRNQSVAGDLEEVRARNRTSRARSCARNELLERRARELRACAETLWPSYQEQRRIRSLGHLTSVLGGKALDFAEEFPDPVPWIPSSWKDPNGCWGASTVRRLVALLLALLDHPDCGAAGSVRRRVHDVRSRADELNPVQFLGGEIKDAIAAHLNRGAEPREALRAALESWPQPSTTGHVCPHEASSRVEAESLSVPQRRRALSDLVDELGELLVDVALAWSEESRPIALTDVLGASAGQRPRRRARELLCALEVIQGAFGGFDHDPEQPVKLGILTPVNAAPLDPCARTTAKEKLAGDELGHFGAFLKRSWRANDWMWGRLDAATFLFKVLEAEGVVEESERADACQQVQREIVQWEAPTICLAVQDDVEAGAHCDHGVDLLPSDGKWDRNTDWNAICGRLGLGLQPEREFLRRNQIGNEQVIDERWSSLLARVGTRAVATTGAVLKEANLPLQSLASRAIGPVRGVSATAHRYVRGLRPPARSKSYLVAVVALVVPAVAAFLDLFGLDIGFLAPLAWLALAAGLLALVLLAPVTSLVAIVGIAAVGFLAALPDPDPNGKPPPWNLSDLPRLSPVVAITIITIVLTVMGSPRIDKLDRWWRGAFLRGSMGLAELRKLLRD